MRGYRFLLVVIALIAAGLAARTWLQRSRPEPVIADDHAVENPAQRDPDSPGQPLAVASFAEPLQQQLDFPGMRGAHALAASEVAMRNDTPMIGVAHAGQAYAVPVAAMQHPNNRVLNLCLGDRAISITYDPVTDHVRALASKSHAPIRLRVGGIDAAGHLVLMLAGQRFGQQSMDIPLEEHRSQRTTFKQWKTEYPKSLVYDSASSDLVVELAGQVDELSDHQRMLWRLAEIDREYEYVPRYGPQSLADAREAYDRARAQRDLVGVLKSIHSMGKELTFAGRPDEALSVFRMSDQVLAEVQEIVPPGFVEDFEAKFYVAKGVAALRKAEDENCVLCQGGESCIFPIGGQGIHTEQEGSMLAVGFLQEALAREPSNLTAAWLLNIAQMTLGSYPDAVPQRYRIPPERLRSQQAIPRFANIAQSLSLDTLSLSGGVIADDVDGDHDLDLVVSAWNTTGQIRLFRNQGDGTFREATKEANLEGIFGGLNLVQSDYDNDGDLDVLVLRGAWFGEQGKHPNSLLRNDGSGRFDDVSYTAGIAGQGLDFPTQTAAWSDYDNDGDLDLLVGNEGFPCQLFENDGSGHFRDVAAERGIAENEFTKGVAWGDVDADGYPEIYLSNYRQANKLLRNEAGKRFTDMTTQAGVEQPSDSFAIWFWDYNNDGNLDLYCPAYVEGVRFLAADYFGVDLQVGKDVLYQGDGRGKFLDVTVSRGLIHPTQTMGCNYGDLNNDGFLEMYLGTGYPGFEGVMPNVMYLNQAGEEFVDVSIAGGFSHLQKGHAIAFADFDEDGDQDVFAELGGAFPGDAFHNALFENPGFDNHWIKLRLVGVKSNRSAIGARIRLTFHDGDSERQVFRWVGSGSSFGANPLRQEIGVGKATKIDELRVDWPTTGHQQTFRDLDVDQLLIIQEFGNEPLTVEIKPMPFDVPKS